MKKIGLCLLLAALFCALSFAALAEEYVLDATLDLPTMAGGKARRRERNVQGLFYRAVLRQEQNRRQR